MTIIHILNHQTGELIGHLDSESDKFFWDAKHVHGLDGEHSQQFTMPADLEEAALLEGRTRFLIPLEDGGFEEFIHFESDTQMEDEKTVYGTPYYKDMDKKYILPPDKYTGTAKELANLVLPFVKFEVGVVEDINKRTITIDRHIGAYSFLEKISSTFNLEIQFRLTTAGSRITGRFADFFKRIGADTHKEIELGKDLLAINMKEHADRIVTGLFCIGPEKEDGTRLTTTVFDNEAFQRWNEDGEHIVDIYEPESTEQDMTLAQLQQYGRTELNKRIASVYEYTVTAASLEELFPHEKVRLGDGVRLKNPEFSPPLYADARVIRIERSLTDPDAKTYDIGEIVTYDEDEVLETFRKLQEQYNMRVIRSAERPTGNSNRIWIQEMANGVEVPHVWSTQLNDWVKVAPTSPAEIGAEPEILSLPAPPDPAIHKKYVDTSGEIAELKMWNPTTSTWDAVKGPKGDAGYTPVKGTDYFDGAPGQDGTDGTSSYLWIRYSQNVEGSGMVDYPTAAKYIGVSTTQIGNAPTEPTAYRWTLIKGTDGLPGEPGDNGQTSYLHIKYSDDGGVTFTANTGEDAGSWIGTYVDFVQEDSASVTAYAWNKVKGEDGADGRGVVSVIEEYYLSTSDEVLSGGSWVTTTPGWTIGHYIWTRIKTVYTNPASTEYTTPTLSSVWGGITAAQTSADGKNAIFYSDTKPPLTGRKVNDIWFDTDDGNKMHRFNGTDFISEEFGSSAFSNIDAGKITSGIIDSVTYRSGFGTTKRFELSDGTATFTEDLPDGLQSITKLNDNGLTVIYSDGVTEQTSELNPMGLMLRSNYAGNTLYGSDYIQMSSGTLEELWLLSTEAYGQIQATHMDLLLTSKDSQIKLGSGGIDFTSGGYYFPNNGEAVTRYAEKGFMAAGSMGGGTTGFATFGGVNFRTKKTYTPSSISYTTVSSNRTPSFHDITPDGFMFALNGSGTTNALVFFRGHYTA